MELSFFVIGKTGFSVTDCRVGALPLSVVRTLAGDTLMYRNYSLSQLLEPVSEIRALYKSSIFNYNLISLVKKREEKLRFFNLNVILLFWTEILCFQYCLNF